MRACRTPSRRVIAWAALEVGKPEPLHQDRGQMKEQHGDDRDSSGPGSPAAASAARSASAAGAGAKMTSHDRDMLCKMAGLCLPQSRGTDDVEDKTE